MVSYFVPAESPEWTQITQLLKRSHFPDGTPPGVRDVILQFRALAENILSEELDALATETDPIVGRTMADWLVQLPKMDGRLIDPSALAPLESDTNPSEDAVRTALFEGVLRAAEAGPAPDASDGAQIYEIIGQDVASVFGDVLAKAFEAAGLKAGASPHVDYLRVPSVALYSAARDAVSRGLPIDAYPPTGRAHSFRLSLAETTPAPENDLSADVLDALASRWIASKAPEAGVEARLDDVLALRGLTPNVSGQGVYSGYKRSQREEIMGALASLRALRLVNDSSPPLPLFEIDVIDGAPPSADTRVRFNPGPAFAEEYQTPLRQTTTLLPLQTLRLRPDTQRFSKRLLRHFSTYWNSWGLDWVEAGALPADQLYDLHRPQPVPDRPDIALARALSRLHEEGLIGTWKRDTSCAVPHVMVRPPWAVLLSAKQFDDLSAAFGPGGRDQR